MHMSLFKLVVLPEEEPNWFINMATMCRNITSILLTTKKEIVEHYYRITDSWFYNLIKQDCHLKNDLLACPLFTKQTSELFFFGDEFIDTYILITADKQICSSSIIRQK